MGVVCGSSKNLSTPHQIGGNSNDSLKKLSQQRIKQVNSGVSEIDNSCSLNIDQSRLGANDFRRKIIAKENEIK